MPGEGDVSRAKTTVSMDARNRQQGGWGAGRRRRGGGSLQLEGREEGRTVMRGVGG